MFKKLFFLMLFLSTLAINITAEELGGSYLDALTGGFEGANGSDISGLGQAVNILVHGLVASIVSFMPLWLMIFGSMKRIREAINSQYKESVITTEPAKFVAFGIGIFLIAMAIYYTGIKLFDTVILPDYAPSIGPSGTTAKFWTVGVPASASGQWGPLTIGIYESIVISRKIIEFMVYLSTLLMFISLFSYAMTFITHREPNSSFGAKIVMACFGSLVSYVIVSSAWEMMAQPILNAPVTINEIAMSYMRPGLNYYLEGEL